MAESLEGQRRISNWQVSCSEEGVKSSTLGTGKDPDLLTGIE